MKDRFDEIEKTKFLVELDSDLCAKIIRLYSGGISDIVHNNMMKEVLDSGYKIKVYMIDWEGREYSFTHSNKKGVDVIVGAYDTYHKKIVKYPDSWKRLHIEKFKERHSEEELTTYEKYIIRISIIPTIYERNLTTLFSLLTGKVDCILFQKIETEYLSEQRIHEAFQSRYIRVLQIDDVKKVAIKDIELRD